MWAEQAATRIDVSVFQWTYHGIRSFRIPRAILGTNASRVDGLYPNSSLAHHLGPVKP